MNPWYKLISQDDFEKFLAKSKESTFIKRVWQSRNDFIQLDLPIEKVHRDQGLCLSFSSDSDDGPRPFFSKNTPFLAKVRSGKESFLFAVKRSSVNGSIVLHVGHQIYLLGQRENERFLCYPKESVYLNTVTPLIRGQEFPWSSKGQEIDFRIEEFSKVLNKQKSPYVEGEEIIGLRVYDLSAGGVSVITNLYETKVLEAFFLPLDFTLSFNGRILSITGVKFLYKEDFCAPCSQKLENKELFRVGLKIDSNPQVEELIRDYIDFGLCIEDV